MKSYKNVSIKKLLDLLPLYPPTLSIFTHSLLKGITTRLHNGTVYCLQQTQLFLQLSIIKKSYIFKKLLDLLPKYPPTLSIFTHSLPVCTTQHPLQTPIF
jgi:hypothetical protein